MGHDEIVQELLDAGAAPDMQDRTGNTALHEAVRWRHGLAVKILMNSDCRINIRNEQGQTPMDIARKDGFNEIVALLTGLEVRVCVECGLIIVDSISYHSSTNDQYVQNPYILSPW